MNKNINKKSTVLMILLSFCIVIIFVLLYILSPVSTKGKDVSFIVTDGESLREIAHSLKKEGLIKSEKFFLGYAVLKDARGIYAAKYELNSNMRLSEIIHVLKTGGKNADEITITFKEGLNMRQIAKVISEETNNSYNDVLKVANDSRYVDSLINKYWFMTKEIKNNQIYYSLEGYLFPDSYNFYSKSISVQEIFDDMISHTGKKLEKYKDKISKSGYSTHQIITMASILELEGIDKNSRKDIAGVFYNRLNKKMNLGSDVTSYYGVKKDLTSDITQSELDSVNAYNTRLSSMGGKLPVGPICNPSIISIEAALNFNKHDYLYFVASGNGGHRFAKTLSDHNDNVAMYRKLMQNK